MPKLTKVALDDLRAHPRNYKAHPPEQIKHLAAAIEQHGVYRNIVVARDNTILAGHGVVQAARSLGLKTIDVCRLDLDPASPEALKVVIGDNEISRLGEVDDQLLSELLKEVEGIGLVGSGFDEALASALEMTASAPAYDEELGSKEAPESFKTFDESLPVEHHCPKCGYAWSGGK